MIVDIVSDLHGYYPQLEGGDLLIVAGDLTANDTLAQINRFKDWLLHNGTYLYKKIVMIAGNHDNWIKRREFFNQDKASWEHPMHSYLEDSGTEFEGLKIWGSPWTAWFDGINPRCTAFTKKTDAELAEKWALIPEDTDILVTHSPPYGILDEAMHTHNYQSVGSKSLLNRMKHIHPHLHVFGHIHEGYGISRYNHDEIKMGWHPIFVNASIMDVNYRPSNKPIRVEL